MRQHITEPDPTGENPARAMTMAFGDAGVEPDEIDYINAHGTSTPVGDAAETRVIKLALGEENARKTPVSSTKGATGHCLGAAARSRRSSRCSPSSDGVLPPTINYDEPDPDVRPRLHPERVARGGRAPAVSNSFGFGGHNASIVSAASRTSAARGSAQPRDRAGSGGALRARERRPRFPCRRDGLSLVGDRGSRPRPSGELSLRVRDRARWSAANDLERLRPTRR